MLSRIGFLVRDLGASELTWRLLRLAHARRDIDVTFFCEDRATPCLPPTGAVLPLANAWSFTGPVVATTMATARSLIHMPGPVRKALYVWDLEWLRLVDRPHRVLLDVYSSAALEIVARSEFHLPLLRNLWGRSATLNPRADLEKFFP